MEGNGIQNETKFKTIFELQKVTSQTVWELSWVVFEGRRGVIYVVFILVFVWFPANPSFRTR